MTALRPVPSEAQAVQQMPQISVGLTTLQGFELAQRAAKCLASSTLVPKEYQNNLSNCIIALNMAQRVGADPLMVMQNLVIVHGRPTWAAQFLIATFNSCGRFSPIRYEFSGQENTDDWGCRATAVELSSGERLQGPLVTIGIAKREGWYGRGGSKWQTMPEQMLRYRSASWFVRTTAPELSMGLQTADEAGDVYEAEQVQAGRYEVVAEQTPAPTPEPIPAPAPAKTESSPDLDKIKTALADCHTVSDMARLMKDMSPAEKRQPEVKALLQARQDEIVANQKTNEVSADQ